GVRRAPWGVGAAARGGVCDPDAVRAIEHRDPDLVLEQSIAEREVITERREGAKKGVAVVGAEGQVEVTCTITDGALVVVALRAELAPERVASPSRAAQEVEALVTRSVDVTGPEETDVAVPERRLAGHAAKVEVEVVRRHEREACPALQVERRCRRLVQLGF